MITLISFILVIIGALNWFLVGALSFDLVSAIFGAATSVGSRIVYILVGIAAIWLLIQVLRHRGRLSVMNDDLDMVATSDTMLSGKKRKSE